MGDLAKWLVIGVVFWLAWRYWRYGATLSLSPNYGSTAYGVPGTGYSFMAPGLVFGFDPQQWSYARGGGPSLAAY